MTADDCKIGAWPFGAFVPHFHDASGFSRDGQLLFRMRRIPICEEPQNIIRNRREPVYDAYQVVAIRKVAVR